MMEKDIEKMEDAKAAQNEILDAVPCEERGRLISIMRESMFAGFMSSNDPISEKITTEHISKVLENTENQDKKDREERKSEKNYQIIFLLIGLAFIGFLIIFLKDDKDLLYKIIIAIISFIGGFGMGKIKKSNTSD